MILLSFTFDIFVIFKPSAFKVSCDTSFSNLGVLNSFVVSREYLINFDVRLEAGISLSLIGRPQNGGVCGLFNCMGVLMQI